MIQRDIILVKVIIVGASGLIGSHLLQLLLQDGRIGEVRSLVRKPMSIQHQKLTQHIVDFDALSNVKESLRGDALFCCLGSTIKKTPDLTDYRKVDHDYPVQLAQLASENQVRQFHLVSALNANENSKVFYTRLKGETEKDIKKVSFESLHIYQPALLTGNRVEHRRFEIFFIQAMKFLNPLLIGGLKKYRSIEASTVAQSMLNQAFKNIKGIHVYPSNIIKKLS